MIMLNANIHFFRLNIMQKSQQRKDEKILAGNLNNSKNGGCFIPKIPYFWMLNLIATSLINKS